MLSVMDDIDKADEERRGVKRKVSLSRCDVCETQESKYRCPNCMKHTCSLACVKRHKTSSGCSGVRDKTAFVSLSQFDEMSLLSDYRFLEDTARLRERSNRDGVLHASRRHPKEGSWLIRRARAVKVTLKFLPKMFSKNRENTTIFKKADKRLHWHLKIHFPQSGAVYSDRFPDNRELCQILNDYIHPSASDPVRRQKLKVYVHSPQEDIKVFMKSEQIKPNSPRFLELDTQKTLGENLMYQTVVEYPEIFVVLKRHSQEYLTQIKERLSSAAPGNLSRTSDETVSKTSAHVEKKTKVISDADELEDGEIRSEEDGSDDDDDGDITDKTAPESHQEAGGRDDDDEPDEEKTEGCIDSLDLHMKMQSKDRLPHDCDPDIQMDFGHGSTSVSIDSRTEESLTVSHVLEDAGGRDPTETLSSISQQTLLPRNDCIHDRDFKNVDGSRQTCTVESDGVTCAHISASVNEGQENTRTNLHGDDTNIYASVSHVCADSKIINQHYIHDSIAAENLDVSANKHHTPTDIQSENDSHANISDSVDGKNANANSHEDHIPADMHTEGPSQANICDSVDEDNANVVSSDGYVATNIHIESASQANLCDSVDENKANVCVSEDRAPVDIHVEVASQAKICDSVAVDNANVCAGNGSITTDIHIEGLSQANLSDNINVDNANVHVSECHVSLCDNVHVANANVGASDSYVATDIHVEGASQAKICDSVHNANVGASDSYIATDIHVKGAGQANFSDNIVVNNANVFASDGYSARDIHVEGASQQNISDSVDVDNANVCASNGSVATALHVEGASQANICDSVDVDNANVTASDVYVSTALHVEDASQANICDGVDVDNANVYVSESHVLVDIHSEGSAQVIVCNSVSDVSGQVSYQSVCESKPRV
ncbi:uncharacterized protein znhit6 isoform X2 [Paramisgurnus dabryanus]|uniref:uncharacterized protein znhit6 isoform X2 n=1 Tax=Paramisgurnus dabryanus TaxID=90735 RepID=UPI0031F3B878